MTFAIRNIATWLLAAAAMAASSLAWSGPNGQPMFYDGCLPDNIEAPLAELKVPQLPASYGFFGRNALPSYPPTSFDYGVTVWRVTCPENPNRRLVMMKFTPTFATLSSETEATIDATVRQGGVAVGSFRFRVSSSASSPGQCVDTTYIRSGPNNVLTQTHLYPPGTMLWWDSSRVPVALCKRSAFPLEPASKDAAFDVDAPFELEFSMLYTAPATMRIGAASAPGNLAVAGDQRGVWWNPDQSGWALAIDRNERGNTYASWITYDERGKPTWYVMLNGEPVAQNVVEGPVFQVSGPAYEMPFDPAKVRLGEPVGKFRIEWTHTVQSAVYSRNDERGVFIFDVNGVQGSSPIRRYLLATPTQTVCSDYRGMFWDPGQSGWGIVFEGGSAYGTCPLFAVWLTYGGDGRPTWFVMPDGRANDGLSPYSFYGKLFHPTGPALSASFDSTQVVLGPQTGDLAISPFVRSASSPGGFVLASYPGLAYFSLPGGVRFNGTIQPMRFEF